MYISKEKYNALVNKIDETKARQEKLEQIIDEKLLCMTKRILREPEKLAEELNEDNKIDEYIEDILDDNISDIEWVNPNTYNYVTLGNKSMKTDEYNKLVSEILHLTNQQGLSISMLESFFNQMIDDVKNNIIPN
jgi:hypothetical protein